MWLLIVGTFTETLSDPAEGFTVELEDENNLFQWRIWLEGPKGTPLYVFRTLNAKQLFIFLSLSIFLLIIIIIVAIIILLSLLLFFLLSYYYR